LRPHVQAVQAHKKPSVAVVCAWQPCFSPPVLSLALSSCAPSSGPPYPSDGRFPIRSLPSGTSPSLTLCGRASTGTARHYCYTTTQKDEEQTQTQPSLGQRLLTPSLPAPTLPDASTQQHRPTTAFSAASDLRSHEPVSGRAGPVVSVRDPAINTQSCAGGDSLVPPPSPPRDVC